VELLAAALAVAALAWLVPSLPSAPLPVLTESEFRDLL